MFNRSLHRYLVALLTLALISTAVNAMFVKCVAVDANSPYWLAVRQQYETSYVPPHLQTVASQTVDANSPYWLAVRQQYETTYTPPQTVDANSPQWLAVRQQYETTYLPPQIETNTAQTSESCHSLS